MTDLERTGQVSAFSRWYVNVAACLAACVSPLPMHVGARAQSYDPATQGPATLLKAPTDALAYHAARQRVRVLLDEKRAVEAETLAGQLVREYPRDGQNWLLLGAAKREMGNFTEAATAHERAAELLGWNIDQVPWVRAAMDHLAAGNRRAALDLLHRGIFEQRSVNRSWLFEQAEFAPLRSDPEFLEIVGRVDGAGWPRDLGWRHDIDFLRDEVKRVNPDYHDRPLPPEFERRHADLKQKVPQLSDEEILVGLNRMLASMRQGHTSLNGLGGSRIQERKLPFHTWLFPEGLFIVNATDEHRDLIGARLVSIEGVLAQEALRRVNETQSVDGDNEYLVSGTGLLSLAPYLKGLGITRSAEEIRVTLQRPGKSIETVTLATVQTYFVWGLAPPPEVQPPLFLRNMTQAHWHQALPEHDALYVQLNQVSDDKDETLSAYGQRLRGTLALSAPSNLILDLRHNPGGTTKKYPELLRTLIGFSQMPGRRIYVLIGRNTYSAAGNLITDLERLADPLFVGEASSECCWLYGDPSSFRLPFSKISGSVAGLRWNLSHTPLDGRREMSPQVPVLLTARDYFAGHDPVMQTVLRMISQDTRLPATASD
jgi:hypothetical protein